MVLKVTQILITLLILSFVAGCGPSYPKERVVESVQKVCKEEYNIDAKAKLVGKTLGVYILAEKLFDQDLKPTQSAFDRMSDALFAITRVVLSSDADIDFCVLVVGDKELKGFQWIITKYVQDTKYMFASLMSREEFFRRTDMDFRYNAKDSLEASVDFELEDVNMGDFLARQIANRIREKFYTDKKLSPLFEITADTVGIYQRQTQQEEPQFIFSVSMAESQLSQVKLENPEALIQRIVLNIAAQTLSEYKFEDFEFVKVDNILTQKTFLVNKDALWKYAKMKIEY